MTANLLCPLSMGEPSHLAIVPWRCFWMRVTFKSVGWVKQVVEGLNSPKMLTLRRYEGTLLAWLSLNWDTGVPTPLWTRVKRQFFLGPQTGNTPSLLLAPGLWTRTGPKRSAFRGLQLDGCRARQPPWLCEPAPYNQSLYVHSPLVLFLQRVLTNI